MDRFRKLLIPLVACALSLPLVSGCVVYERPPPRHVVYVQSRPGYVWVPGHWVHRPGADIWVEGHWRPI